MTDSNVSDKMHLLLNFLMGPHREMHEVGLYAVILR